MSAPRIEAGDRVNVFWEHIEPLLDVEVTYTPCASGDVWMLKSKDGTVIYVHMFCRMVKL